MTAQLPSRGVAIPPSMQTRPFVAPRTVEVKGEIPLFDHKKDAAENVVRERRIAHARIFNLLQPDDLLAYEAVWQKVCDKAAEVANPVMQPIYVEGKGMLAYLRWVDFNYLPPGMVPEPVVVPPAAPVAAPAVAFTPPQP